MSSINKSSNTTNSKTHAPQTSNTSSNTKDPTVVYKQYTPTNDAHSQSSNNNNSNNSGTNSLNSDGSSSTSSTHKKRRHRNRKKNKNTNAKKNIQSSAIKNGLNSNSMTPVTKTNDNILNINKNMQNMKISNDSPIIPSTIDIRDAYKRKKLKHSLMYNQHICIDNKNIQHLKQLLGSKKCQMYGNTNNELFNKCVVCEEICIEGELAVETVLFIPKKNNPAYKNLGRFRCKLPRVCCWDCCKEDGYQLPQPPITWKSIANVWQIILQMDTHSTTDNTHTAGNTNTTTIPVILPTTIPTTTTVAGNERLTINMQHSGDSNNTYISYGSRSNSEIIEPSVTTTTATTASTVDAYSHTLTTDTLSVNNIQQQQQSQPQQFAVQYSSSPFVNHHTSPTMMTNSLALNEHQIRTNVTGVGTNDGLLPIDSERDPFDDGFLICTQLVKTGGADQGGLQVGDVFVQFGIYSKSQFPGLKSIANLVRRSAGKEINAIVWRKLEQTGGGEDDDGSGRTVFQKLALKLRPLQSHDADGGGVLGSVVNSYPLPEMHN